MTERVRLRIDAHVADVCLNRPEKYNALDAQSFDELSHVGELIKSDPTVRAVVLRGEGEHFCSGLDLESFGSELADKRTFERQALTRDEGEIANRFQKPAWVWHELEVPVIAALQGVVYGGGLQIALAADLRLAGPSARLSVMEIVWGLIPDMAISQTLLPLVRPDIARDLIMTGRVVERDEALALGLITRAVEDPRREAESLAGTLAERSPEAIRRAKRLINAAPQLDAASALRLEAELQCDLVATPNQQEAVRARLEKRQPRFD